MKIIRTIRRTIATVILTAGLAYPVCAAVCPKGIGGCTSPGRCFLFTDADGNALCDYTARTGTQVLAGPGSSGAGTPVQTPVSVVSTAPATPAPGVASSSTTTQFSPVTAPTRSVTALTPSPDTPVTVLQNTTSAGILDTIQLSVPLTVTVLLLLFAGFFFALVRTGIAGVRIEKPLPALGLSSLLALGFSLMATFVLSGDAIAGTTYVLIYMGAGTLLAAYLWYTGVMTRKVVLVAVTTAALAGFVFIAPIMPLELGGIVNVMTGVSAMSVGVIVICAVVALTLVVGRTFCGTVCPVGSVQELAFAAPLQKIVIRRTKLVELIRLAVFIATVFAAIYLIDLMAFTGLYDLFSLTLSASFFVAAIIILISVFVYRPLCRILCPFGVLFSVFAEFSVLRLRRTKTCISCNKCEKVCPAATAGEHDSKRECYLCGRCTDACPKKTALAYCR